MKDRVKELRRVPASELRANPKNWRRHPPSQEAALRGVLEDIGFADAVIARETDDGLELIDGHLRQEVMGDQSIPVLIVDVTEEEADKILLTHDPLAMMAHADTDQLLQLLRDTQFADKAVNDMLEAVANGERLPMPDLTEPVDDPGPQIDRADELREKWQTERGQVWEVGRHRLMCGDSTSIDAVDKLMDGQKADMVFTDPPYGVDYDGINNDDRAGLEDLLQKSFDCFARAAKSGAAVYVFHSDKCADIFHKVFREYFHFSSMIIWEKNSLTLSRTDYQSIHEPCLYGWQKDGSHQFYGDRKQLSVWKCDKERVEGHTTPKPVELIGNALDNSSKGGDIVLDLFGGSGTTAIAAEKNGRHSRLMELDPKYCDVIVVRWQDFTGKQAKLEEGGETFPTKKENAN